MPSLLNLMRALSSVCVVYGGLALGVGGFTVGGSLITNIIKSKKSTKKADAELQKYCEANKFIKEQCLSLSEQLEYFETIEDRFPEWVEFWKLYVHGKTSNTNDFNWTQTKELLSNSLQNVEEPTARFVGEEFETGIRIAGAAIRVTGTSLRVLSGIIGALMIPLNVYMIVHSAIDLHKKNRHETSKIINGIVDAISMDIPTEEQIKTVIRHTLNNLRVC